MFVLFVERIQPRKARYLCSNPVFMTHPDLVTMVLHGFLVQGASDLLMLWLFGLGSSTHRRFAAAVGELAGGLVPGVAIAPRHLLFNVPRRLIKAPLGASFPSPVGNGNRR